jgi:hypothetical protein
MRTASPAQIAADRRVAADLMRLTHQAGVVAKKIPDATLSKRTRPETLHEARSFEAVKNNAFAFGLCLHDASKLAWGHQNGFKELAEPCSSCRPKLQVLPVEKNNGWKTVAGRAASSSSWPAGR